MIYEPVNILFKTNAEDNLLVGHQGFDVVCFTQILGIIDQNLNAVFTPAQRHPDIVEQKRLFEFTN